LETSIVPIPANAEATRGLKALGLWRADDQRFTLPNMPAERPVSELDAVLATRAAFREALTGVVADAVRRRIHGSAPYLLVSDSPATGAAHAMRHHVGNDPTVVNIELPALKRMTIDSCKTLMDGIEDAVALGLRRARGRID
jgi:hypothetical protein